MPSGSAHLVFEVVRKDTYNTLANLVEEEKKRGLVVVAHENLYLKRISSVPGIDVHVLYPDRSEVVDPRVMRDRTVMILKEFVSENDRGYILLDVFEELGKRLPPAEMEKALEAILSFRSCRHTIIATLNPVELPRSVVKTICSFFDTVQDVRAASLGGEKVECPHCGAMWDSLVTVCSMCGYDFKKHTIRVTTPAVPVEKEIAAETGAGNAVENVEKGGGEENSAGDAADDLMSELLGASGGDSAPGEKGEEPVEVLADGEVADMRRREKEEFFENLTFKFLSTEGRGEKNGGEVAVKERGEPEDREDVNWFQRGVSLELKGDSQAALAAYDMALQQNPNDPWIWLNRGVSLQRLGRLEEALESYDRSIALEPNDPDAWSNRGTVLRGLGRLEEAVESYRKALHLNPRDSGVWSNLGIALRSMGRYDEALEAYEHALAINPQDIGIWLNKAAVLNTMKRFREALECYDRILEMDPDNVGARELRKILLRRMGREGVEL